MENIQIVTIDIIISTVMWIYIKNYFINNKLSNYIKLAIIFFVNTIIIYSLYNAIGFNNLFITLEGLIVVLLLITVVDIKNKEIPIELIAVGLIFGVICISYNPNVIIVDIIIGCFGIGGTIVLLSLATKGAIGLGDAQVIALIGLYLGWRMTLAIILYAVMLSGVIGLTLITLKRANRKDTMPFVPYLLIATLIVVLV